MTDDAHDDATPTRPAGEASLPAMGATTVRIALRPGRSAHDVVRSLQLSTQLLDAQADATGTVIEVVLVLDPPRLEERLQALRAQASVDQVRSSPTHPADRRQARHLAPSDASAGGTRPPMPPRR